MLQLKQLKLQSLKKNRIPANGQEQIKSNLTEQRLWRWKFTPEVCPLTKRAIYFIQLPMELKLTLMKRSIQVRSLLLLSRLSLKERILLIKSIKMLLLLRRKIFLQTISLPTLRWLTKMVKLLSKNELDR